MEVQSLLFAEVMGGASKNAIKSVTKRLNTLWKDVRLSATGFHTVILLFKPGDLIYKTPGTGNPIDLTY